MADPISGKERARASRLRKKVKEGTALSDDDASFLDDYNKRVAGVDKPEIEEDKEPEFIPDIDLDIAQLEEKEPELVTESPPVVSDTKVSTSETKSQPAKRVEMFSINKASEPACSIKDCPCKRTRVAGKYCPVLKRYVYPEFARDQSEMYARAFFGAIKLIFEMFTSMSPVEPTDYETRTVCMAIESLQKSWDQIAAISNYVNPIFGIMAMVGFARRTVSENRKPKQLKAANA